MRGVVAFGINWCRADDVGLKTWAGETVVGAQATGVVAQSVEQGGSALASSTDDAATRYGNAGLTHTTTSLRWR